LAGKREPTLGRLNASAPATQSLTFCGSTITWNRGGSSPEVWRASFDASTNGINRFSVGVGIRVPAGWQLTGLSLPASALIRARGFIISFGYSASSAWFVETVTSPPSLLILQDANFGFSSNRFGFDFSTPEGQVVVVEGSQDLVTSN